MNAVTTIANNRYLDFTLGKEEYAIPLLSVREVIALPEVTPVPFAPPHFYGLMNLRGQVISVIDLRLKFGIKPVPSSENAVIICDLGGSCLGVVVDAINSVLAANPEELSEKPDLQNNKLADCITGVYKEKDKLILLVDVGRSLGVEDHKLIQKHQPKAA